ncbi:epoxide hydrolase 3 isoform X2 [Eumetopias jubatus]|uniref:epoxide hydrolase 3 isoform X2 n=1 Tax=Eumetopias jubatus TaxID=34886 RepID=UPI001016946C|nr:epoxide hydrolase 3 isoform X2 [Eumetopias jubatus]
MFPPDMAMGPSCCFCTASQRTGRSEAQGPGAHKAGGEAGGGARTTRASRRQARGLGRLGSQSIQMGCSRTGVLSTGGGPEGIWDKEVLDTEYRFSWRYQLWEFQSRFHVVAVDLRGYGSSDAPQDVDCYTMDLLMTDIQDVILGLGYSKCILVAHDWGALLAWNFSIYYPSLVERMVIVSAAPMSVYQDYSIRHIGQFFRSNYVFLFQLPWLPEKLLSMSDFQILKTTLTHRKRGIPHLTPNELEAFLYDFSQPGGLTGPLNYYRNLFRNFPLEPQELATPTLLLWGAKDTYFDQGLVGAISSRFVPGRLEAHILPGMGHWIPQSNPREMHEYMWAFLRDLLD